MEFDDSHNYHHRLNQLYLSFRSVSSLYIPPLRSNPLWIEFAFNVNASNRLYVSNTKKKKTVDFAILDSMIWDFQFQYCTQVTEIVKADGGKKMMMM